MPNIAELAADKAFLRSIAGNAYKLPGDLDHFVFLKALVQNFASTDAQLRDELTYMILAHAVIDEESSHVLSTSQREELLLTCVDSDHLFYGIDESGSDSVFMRSFSLLIVAALLFADAKRRQLSEGVTRQAHVALMRYAKEERDWRGYIQGKGWAHAAAHLSDALDECAQNRYMLMPDREAVMQTLTHLATLPVPLCYEEDDRMAFAAYRVISNKLVDEAFLETWVESFFVSRTEEVPGLTEQDVSNWVRAANAKNFLRSLYFRLLWNQKAPFLVERIANVLRRLDPIPAEESSGEEKSDPA